MTDILIKLYDDKEVVDCPELGYNQDLVNCFRCKYFQEEAMTENKEQIIKCKFEIKKEEK